MNLYDNLNRVPKHETCWICERCLNVKWFSFFNCDKIRNSSVFKSEVEKRIILTKHGISEIEYQ